ncbi:secretion-regulating guanine nucleotide exchange factor [Pholidichthys leucotaenia]
METRSQPEFCLHAWGANSYGQLGQGHVEDQSSPLLCATEALLSRAVRTVSGGGGHSVIITESGEVLVCGQNHRGQLGLGHTGDISTFQRCPVLNQQITDLACGWDFTLLLTDCGQLLVCGSNSFGQLGVGQSVTHSADLLLLETLKEKIVSVAAGLRHSLAVTDSGSVYQWGTGLFSHARRVLSPRPVPSHLTSKVPCPVPGLDHETSWKATAGSVHCGVLTEGGDLFLWGSNKHGQLTTADPFLCSPTLLKRSLLNGEKVLNVWSGWTHIVAQTESSQVFTWGRGDYGQLGWKISTGQDTEQQSAESAAEGDGQGACLPAEVKDLRGATQIACGSEHNLAIVGVYILIAVGAVMMLVGFLGCYGAIQESQCLLGTFFFFLVLLFACEVAAAIWGFMNRDTISKELITFYDSAYIKALDVLGSPNKDAAIAVLNAFHRTLDCCGKGDNTELFMQVVSTLCPSKKSEDIQNVSQSCHNKLIELFSKKLYLIGLAALVVAVIMIFEMIFTMVLCCGIHNSPGVY